MAICIGYSYVLYPVPTKIISGFSLFAVFSMLLFKSFVRNLLRASTIHE